MRQRLRLCAALALSACTRSTEAPAPATPSSNSVNSAPSTPGAPDARASLAADASSATGSASGPADAGAGLERVPVALAHATDGATLVLVRRQPRARDEEIVPTLGAMGAIDAARDALAYGATPSTVLSLTPEHELLRWSDGSWSVVSLAEGAASLALLSDATLVSLSREEPAVAQRLTAARWEPVAPALQSLLSARVGDGALSQRIDPSSVAIGTAPVALFLRCADATNRWREGACTPHAIGAGATLGGDGDLVAVPAASATLSAMLRPQCADEQSARCAIDAHVFNTLSAAPAAPQRLGQLAMNEQHNPGWYALRAVEGALVAGWRAQAPEPRAVFSLRFARLDAGARRFAPLPVIQAESAPTAITFGGAPLTVVWTHESEPSTWSISTLNGARFTTALAPQINGTLVDAAITQSPAGPIVTLLAVNEQRQPVLLRREPSREWQTTVIPAP